MSRNPTSRRFLPTTASLRAMGLNVFTLSFPKELESIYYDEYYEKSIPQVRMAIILGAILYGVFGALDAIMVPEITKLFWAMRYGLVIPALAAVFALTYRPVYRRLFQPTMSGVMALGGGVIIAMIVLAGPPVSYSYYAGLILIFFWGYTFIRLRFVWATATALMIVLCYEIAAVLTGTPWPTLVNNNFFFISANVIGMFACYSIEYFLRRDFYITRLLKEEKEKVKEANRDLEQRVLARTCELEERNRDLRREMAERERMESEKAELEEKLIRSEKMEAIGRLAGGVAHDLNNVLNAIVGYPDLILMMMPADSPHRPHILTMQRSGLKAAAIVRDLLTLARRGVKVNRIVDISILVAEYIESPEHERLIMHHPNATVEVDVQAGLWNVEGSPLHLSKTIMNLVSNAAEAMPGGGKINVSAYNRTVTSDGEGHEATLVPGEYVVLEVSDTGVGISAEDRKKIFEPFYTKKVMGRSGTGLGMAVVWGTVEDHSGSIDVQSVEGQGATFSIYFPRTLRTEEQERDDRSCDDFRGQGEKILVVDDIKEQRDLARHLLENLGYSVITAASGEAAIEFMKRNEAALVVLDMIMDPGIDGLDTYRRILAMRPGTKAIIASGFSENERARETIRLGAGEYIMKPYTLRKIGAAVRAELGRDSRGD